MMRASPPELLIAYPVLGDAKTDRLVKLADQTKVTVSVDSIPVARALAAAAKEAGVRLGILIELDTGLHRVGLTAGEALRQLALMVAESPALRFEGLAFYPGHVKAADPVGGATLLSSERVLRTAIATLDHLGLNPQVVSGGSTPAMAMSHWLPSMNEIRPGTYIFNDRNTVFSGACTWEDCRCERPDNGGIYVRPRSRHSRRRIQDLFLGSCGRAGVWPNRRSCGCIFEKMNEEHGFVDAGACARRWKVGEKCA
jgi:D-serine deaminase-like pyridoxal phosphate-dependent protein